MGYKDKNKRVPTMAGPYCEVTKFGLHQSPLPGKNLTSSSVSIFLCQKPGVLISNALVDLYTLHMTRKTSSDLLLQVDFRPCFS